MGFDDNLRKVFLLVEGDESAIRAFASRAHEEWRRGFDPAVASGKPSKQRVKKNSDGTEGDINVPFDQLHPDWQRENLAGGRAALEAIRKFPDDDEAAAAYVHEQWMLRNPKQDWNAAQHIPYASLPEGEKEKDRVQVRVMQELLGTGDQ